MIGGFGKDEGGFAQASHLELKVATIQSRHPELVSGSIVPQAMTPNGEEWMLKQVQHDGHDTTNFSSTILDRTLQNPLGFHLRSEEHTSELQSLMRISYAVFCLKKKIINDTPDTLVLSAPTSTHSSLHTTTMQPIQT